jgi:hypothetical protein
MLGLVTGLITGGAVSGLLAWLISGLVAWVPATVGGYVVAFAAAAAVLRDWRLVRFPLPERRAQVPRSILDRPAPWAALGFGIELGLGFRTYVSASAPYLLLTVLVLHADDTWTYLLAGASFGLGRFAIALARYLTVDGDLWDELIERRATWIRTASAVVAAAGSAAVLWTAG